MGQPDFADLSSSLSASSLKRGVVSTLVFTPPPGGSWVFGYNSIQAATGGHGKYVDLAGFTPTGSGPSVPDGGGCVRGCVKRESGGNVDGFSPFLFFGAQGDSINDVGYMLGLSDADPYEIVLAKGVLSSGLYEDAVTFLRRSSAQFALADDLWHHLRLDALVEPNGEVLLKCYQNNLDVHPLGGVPDWQPIPGMSDFSDDPLCVNTGSAPLWGGWCGWAYAVRGGLNRRGAFCGIEAEHQA